MARQGFDPQQVGWKLGRSLEPHGVDLWVPFDRTTGVIGPQGSGKTLDLLTPALLDAPGAALVTLTKVEDLLLSLSDRSRASRPCVVLDPFGLTQGIADELVWDPLDGCVDPRVAERRAKAFTAGTIKGATSEGTRDDAARFYAAESAKVLQTLFHAAALTGRNLDDVLEWVAHPIVAREPHEILTNHPMAAPFWARLLEKAIRGDERTAANTITTVQQAMALFFQPEIRRRCVPGKQTPATDLHEVIRRGGTIYLLGREDPYASASPLMTAVAEAALDIGLELANASPFGGRLCPPLTAILDELPSTAPLPTLRTRMANERALGLAFVWAAQTRAQIDAIFGEQEARSVLGLTNVLVVFGGSKDVAFNKDISQLLDTTHVTKANYQTRSGGRTFSSTDISVLSPGEIRELRERTALVIAENSKPIIARLHRCVESKRGGRLLADQASLRSTLHQRQRLNRATGDLAAEALAASQRLGMTTAKGSNDGT